MWQVVLIDAVDDIADTNLLTALYSVIQPSQVPLIPGILKKRPVQVQRDKMWSDLQKKYPDYFVQNPLPIKGAAPATAFGAAATALPVPTPGGFGAAPTPGGFGAAPATATAAPAGGFSAVPAVGGVGPVAPATRVGPVAPATATGPSTILFGGGALAAAPAAAATAPAAGDLFGAPAAPPSMPGAPVAAGGMHGQAGGMYGQAGGMYGQAGGMFGQPAAAAGMFGVVSDAPCQSWSAVEVGDWLRSLNFGDFTQTYADSFKAMGVEGGDLQFIDEQGLYEFGIRSKVHRHKILRKISTLLS